MSLLHVCAWLILSLWKQQKNETLLDIFPWKCDEAESLLLLNKR